MNYRIVKRHWRNEETAKIQYSFQVQQYIQLFWSRKMVWKPVKRLVAWGYDEPNFSKENANFDTLENAQEYLDNLIKDLPKDAIMALTTK